MATAGLSFANPMLGSMGVGEPPNPYAPFNPTSNIGMGGLAPSAADLAVAGEALAKQSQFTMPEMRRPPAIAFSPSSKQLFVNGLTFAADDAATALQSESYLRGPGTQLPTGGDWVPLDEQAYGQYLQSIRQPSIGRLMSKNFGRGVDQLQMLAGRGLQLAGAEQLGGRIVAAQEKDLAKTAPFERQFTDIKSGGDAVDWFLANLAQQGPNLLESVALGLAGAAAGTAAAGPVGGAAGALAGFFGKKAFKDKVLDAAQKVASGAAGKGSTEYALLRNTAAVAGATAANFASNIATGAADIYGEMREQGVGPEDFGARLTALAGSLPYAGLETLGEYFVASRILGPTRSGRAALPAPTTTTTVTPGGKTVVTTSPSVAQRGGELLRRAATGFAVGAPLEGLTELGQEALVVGLSGQSLTSPEAINRFINSFAAGAAVGGTIGGLANLRSRPNDETNLLDNTPPGRGLAVIPPPQPTPPGTAVTPYYSPVTFGGRVEYPLPPTQLAEPPTVPQLPGPVAPVAPMAGPPTIPQLPGPVAPVAPVAPMAGPPTIPQLPGPVAPVAPMGEPVMIVTPEGVAYPNQMLRQQGNVPSGAPGTQGVSDVLGGQIPAQKLTTQMQPQARIKPKVEILRRGASRAQRPATGLTALRAAGVKTKLPPAPSKAPVVKPRAQRGLKKQAGVAAVEIVPKEKPSATQTGKLKQGRVAKRAEDNAGVRAGGQAGEQPKTQVPAGGAQAGGGGKPVVSGAKSQEIKKGEPKGPKVEAAPAAVSAVTEGPKVEAAPAAVTEGPIPLSLELADGGKLKTKDGQKLVDKLDQDIKKLKNLLVCLTSIR